MNGENARIFNPIHVAIIFPIFWESVWRCI